MTGPAASQDAGDEAGAKRWETKTLTFDNVHVHAVVARALGIDMRHSARLRDGTVPSIPRSIHSHHILGSYIHHYIMRRLNSSVLSLKFITANKTVNKKTRGVSSLVCVSSK